MTIEELGKILALLVGIITGFEFLIARFNKILDKKLDPIVSKQQEEHLQRLKIDLIMYMSLADQDLLTGELRTSAYETFDEYTKLGGNSYIHSYWERLKKQNKI